MTGLLVKEKEIVTPGQRLAEGLDFLPAGGAYREKEFIISQHVGIMQVSNRLIKVIPLRGRYMAKRGDTVIGEVEDMTFSTWFINIGGSNDANLSVREATEFVERGEDLSKFYSFGDVVVAKIHNVARGNVDLTMKGPGLRKLKGGRLSYVDSSKVPRIIGKQGSMISMIKEKTGCRIIVGQNGVVWIDGTPKGEALALKVIQKINNESHKPGLTDEIGKMLEKELGGTVTKKESDGSEKNVQEKK